MLMLTKTVSRFAWIVLLLTPQQVATQVTQYASRGAQQEATPELSPSTSIESQGAVNDSGEGTSEAQNKERDAKEQAFKTEQLNQNRIIKNATIVIAVFTALNVLIAGVYAYFAGRQWQAVRRQADIIETAERPVIVVDSAEIIPRLAPNIPLRARVMFSNAGRTPARNLSITAEIAPPGFAYLALPKSTARDISIVLLAAEHHMAIEAAPADALTLDVEMYEKIMDGKTFLLIYGRGQYENLAGKVV